MIGETISHYRILEKIGEGGMGEVYLAEDTELRRRVALKFLPAAFADDRDALARFKREAQAAAALHHSNIITIHDVSTHGPRPYIVMAYVEGELLHDVIARGPRLSRALDIAVALCDGLSAAHGAGVIHRDIKPTNILIGEDGAPRILDFGLAKLEGSTRLTRESSTLGTVHYMAPEQARGEDVDPRADIFSLGAVLYEMITGHQPFPGQHREAVFYAIANEDPQPLARYSSQATPELQRIVSKALARDPKDRYQSAADLASDLRAVRRDMSPGPSPARAARRHPARAIAAVAVVLLIGAALVWSFARRGTPAGSAVQASDTSLAVMYIDNLADPEDGERLGEIITNLIITELSNSPALRVVSSQRLYDILKNLDREGVKKIDRNTATLVATSAGARWMLLGSILQVEPQLVITSQLVEVATGDVVKSQRIDAAPGATVFEAADRMTLEVRRDLPVALDVDESSINVAGLTTHSPDAYRYYVEGLEQTNQYDYDGAEESFHKAIDIDSTFAMAWCRLAEVTMFFQATERLYFAEQALKYASNATARDRHYIRAVHAHALGRIEEAVRELETLVDMEPDNKQALYYLSQEYYTSGDFAGALERINRVIEIDPLFKLAYNEKAYLLHRLGDIDGAFSAVDRYQELSPGEANPHDTRGDLFALSNKPEQAIESYRRALAIKPDQVTTQRRLLGVQLLIGEFDAVRATVEPLLAAPAPLERAMARSILGSMLVFQGRFDAAIEQLEASIEADADDGVTGFVHTHKHILLSSIYQLQGDYDRAEALLAKAREVYPSVGQTTLTYKIFQSRVYAAQDRPAEIARLAGEADELATAGHIYARQCHAHIRGILALEQGDTAAALSLFARAAEHSRVAWTVGDLAYRYLQAGRAEESAALYDRFLTAYTAERSFLPVMATLAYYYSGIALEQLGRSEQAAARYERFLEAWENANPRVEQVDDARRRLDRLKRGL